MKKFPNHFYSPRGADGWVKFFIEPLGEECSSLVDIIYKSFWWNKNPSLVASWTLSDGQLRLPERKRQVGHLEEAERRKIRILVSGKSSSRLLPGFSFNSRKFFVRVRRRRRFYSLEITGCTIIVDLVT